MIGKIQDTIDSFKELTSAGGYWDTRLTDEEIERLWQGEHPTCIQSNNLVEYWPPIGEVD